MQMTQLVKCKQTNSRTLARLLLPGVRKEEIKRNQPGLADWLAATSFRLNGNMCRTTLSGLVCVCALLFQVTILMIAMRVCVCVCFSTSGFVIQYERANE